MGKKNIPRKKLKMTKTQPKRKKIRQSKVTSRVGHQDIKELHFLKQFSPEHRQMILDQATEKTFKAGTVLAKMGQASSGFYIIESGRVQLSIKPHHSLQTLSQGQVVGWSWILPPHKWAFDVKAVTDSQILFIDGKNLKSKMISDPLFGFEIMKAFFKVMTDRLKHSRIQLMDLYKNPNQSESPRF